MTRVLVMTGLARYYSPGLLLSVLLAICGLRGPGRRPEPCVVVVPADAGLLTCDILGGLERVRVAGLGVCRLPVADLRADTGSEWGPGGRRRSGGLAAWDSAGGLGGRPGVAILL